MNLHIRSAATDPPLEQSLAIGTGSTRTKPAAAIYREEVHFGTGGGTEKARGVVGVYKTK